VTHRGVTQHYNDITQRHNNVTQRHNDITQRHNDITQRHNNVTQRHRDNFDNKKQLSIPDIIHRFKTLTTKQYINGVKKHGWTPFPGKFWQRNYYEHIIRNDKSLHRIKEYIKNNPLNWEKDNHYK
ncbi:MAG: transposase, partial [Spirochaetota bacterium]